MCPPHALRHWRGDPGVAVSSLRLVFLCGCPPGAMLPSLFLAALEAREDKQPVSWSPLLPLVQTHGCPGETVCEGRSSACRRGLQPELQGVGLSEAGSSPPRSPSPARPFPPLLYPKIHSRPCETGPVGSVASEERDRTGPGGTETWLGASRAREQRVRVVEASSREIFFSSTDKVSAPTLGTGCCRERDRPDPHRREFLSW